MALELKFCIYYNDLQLCMTVVLIFILRGIIIQLCTLTMVWYIHHDPYYIVILTCFLKSLITNTFCKSSWHYLSWQSTVILSTAFCKSPNLSSIWPISCTEPEIINVTVQSAIKLWGVYPSSMLRFLKYTIIIINYHKPENMSQVNLIPVVPQF